MQPHSVPRGSPAIFRGGTLGSEHRVTGGRRLPSRWSLRTTRPLPSTDALPNSIRQAVDEVQLFVQAPIELVASSALTALSIACQQLADVRRADKPCGPVNLYLLTVANRERKSSVDGYFMQPIRDYERAQREASKNDLANHSCRDGGGRKEPRSCSRSPGEGCERQQSRGRARKPTSPNPEGVQAKVATNSRWLLYGDVTREKLTRDLATNWPAAGIVSSVKPVLRRALDGQ